MIPLGVSSMIRFATVCMNSWSLTGEQDISLECLQRIIEGLDGFQVQVVGRSIQDQAVASVSIIREIIQRIFSPPESTLTFS